MRHEISHKLKHFSAMNRFHKPNFPNHAPISSILLKICPEFSLPQRFALRKTFRHTVYNTLYYKDLAEHSARYRSKHNKYLAYTMKCIDTTTAGQSPKKYTKDGTKSTLYNVNAYARACVCVHEDLYRVTMSMSDVQIKMTDFLPFTDLFTLSASIIAVIFSSGSPLSMKARLKTFIRVHYVLPTRPTYYNILGVKLLYHAIVRCKYR